MSTTGRDIAHHSLYPDSYVPRKPSRMTILCEIGADVKAFAASRMWFVAVCIAAFTWLAYIFVRWALTVQGAMRIGGV